MSVDFKDVPGDNNTKVTLAFSDTFEGWHCKRDFPDDAIAATDTAEMIAELLADTSFAVRTGWPHSTPAIEILRKGKYLDGYERGLGDFGYYIEQQIKENFWDLDNLISFETEKYDNKRGACHVSAEFETTLGELRVWAPDVRGWTATVPASSGKIVLDL